MGSQSGLRFLSDAGALLARPGEPRMIAESVMRAAVPGFADWAALDLFESNGSVRRLAVAGEPPEPQGAVPVPDVQVGSRVPVAYENLGAAHRAANANADPYLVLLSLLGFRSALVVPMIAGGEILGAVVIAASRAEQVYGETDLAVATEVAARLALVLQNAQLRRAAAEARRLRDQVLTLVSHELRTPLTTIGGVIQLLLRRVDPQTPVGNAQVVERLDLLDRAATQLGSLIEEILDVARLEEGRPLDLNRQSIDLLQLARQAAAAYENGGDEQPIRIEARVPELIGWWDAARIRRVLSKLLANALRFGPADTVVTVSVRRREEPGTGGWAELAVHDEGEGISAADLPDIFDRTRHEASIRRRGRLDLAGCRDIAEQHGGTLTAENGPEGGATFRLLLPL